MSGCLLPPEYSSCSPETWTALGQFIYFCHTLKRPAWPSSCTATHFHFPFLVVTAAARKRFHRQQPGKGACSTPSTLPLESMLPRSGLAKHLCDISDTCTSGALFAWSMARFMWPFHSTTARGKNARCLPPFACFRQGKHPFLAPV